MRAYVPSSVRSTQFWLQLYPYSSFQRAVPASAPRPFLRPLLEPRPEAQKGKNVFPSSPSAFSGPTPVLRSFRTGTFEQSAFPTEFSIFSIERTSRTQLDDEVCSKFSEKIQVLRIFFDFNQKSFKVQKV